MPGNMSKEDAPSRSASLTFTIDNILNLKQRASGNFDGSKEQRDSGCKNDFQERFDEVWDVRRRHDSGAEETGMQLWDLISVRTSGESRKSFPKSHFHR